VAVGSSCRVNRQFISGLCIFGYKNNDSCDLNLDEYRFGYKNNDSCDLSSGECCFGYKNNDSCDLN
jgi:hypothetical protein